MQFTVKNELISINLNQKPLREVVSYYREIPIVGPTKSGKINSSRNELVRNARVMSFCAYFD